MLCRVLKNFNVQKFAVVDVTGDKILELLCNSSELTTVKFYDTKNDCDCVSNIIDIKGSTVRYDASQKVIIGYTCYKIKGGNVEEGEDPKWKYVKVEGADLYNVVKLTKNHEAKSTDDVSKWYTIYNSKYKDEIDYIGSKSKFDSAEKKYKALKSKVCEEYFGKQKEIKIKVTEKWERS